MTVVPQQYTLQCVYSGWYNEFRWYNNNSELNCGSPQNGFSCDINPTPNQNHNCPITIRSLFRNVYDLFFSLNRAKQY